MTELEGVKNKRKENNMTEDRPFIKTFKQDGIDNSFSIIIDTPEELDGIRKVHICGVTVELSDIEIKALTVALAEYCREKQDR